MKHEHDTTSRNPGTTTKDVVRWTQDLMDLHARIAPRFVRPEPRRRALRYLQGILSEVKRKNSWSLAQQAREGTPYGMQRLLSQAIWDDRLVREDVRSYVYEHLGPEEATLVIDETSFRKRGKKSAGVKVQYCGTTGQVENCQVAVFLDYVTPLGHTLIDADLYLPKEWTDDRQRCREAGIPESVRFQTKCELAREQVLRVEKAQIPIAWVVADTVYGNNLDLRDFLEEHGYHFVLAVACDEPVGIRTADGQRKQVEVREVEALLLRPRDWQRLSMGDGCIGPRFFDWASVPILHQWEDDGCHWLLIRRCLNDASQKAYYFVFGPNATTLQEMVKAIGRRWRIEDDFETSKDLGLDHYQVRSFLGRYRHITLVMLAHACLAVICADNRKPVGASPTDVSSSVRTRASSPSVLPGTSLAAPPFTCMPSPSMINPIPLTVPEVRYLLGHLIWPMSTNATFVLAWSQWRRCHQGRASFFHTRRRLDAG